jgi:hypothetical protein
LFVSLPPEVLFHRYFQEYPSPEVRTHYWGKRDLSGSDLTDFQRLLLLLQVSLNNALEQADTIVSHHAVCPPFHIDYIDSDVENAIAFRYESYSFIGLTEPLMYKLWQVSVAVSELGTVAFRTAVQVPFEAEGLRVVLFRAMLFFIVCHEYTHHRHGHVLAREIRSVFFDEIRNHNTGNLESQIIELDADGWATFLVLNHLIAGESRQIALPLLNFEKENASDQDQMLFSCFVLATGAFFFTTPPARVNSSNVYTFEHPPQAARMNCVMQQARRWCDFKRPGLNNWMTLERFNIMMNIVVHATWGMNGGKDWSEQTAFFRSEDGTEYFRKLDAGLAAYIESLEENVGRDVIAPPRGESSHGLVPSAFRLGK